VLYGEGFDPQTRAILAGPVYSLTNLTTPLCSVIQGQCPTVTLAAGVNASGTAMGFAVPGSTAPGVYYVLAQTGSGQQTAVGQFLMVQTPLVTYPAVPASQKLLAQPLIPGQTIQGTFVENSDPSGKTSDMNVYYFFGTAGSTVTVDLQRADTSLPWEHPDALDPQVRITAPDGLIYANLRQIDNQPGVDLNATLTNAVLPQTGIYFIAAETTKGGGNYTLNFSFGSVAPVSGTARAIPFLGNYNTAAVNTTISSTATMLDPRGYPLAGAAVTFAPAPASDDLGSLEFPGGSSVHTSGEGFAIIRTLLTRPGKVEFAPAISDVHLQRLHATSAVPMEIPRYAPVASAPFHVTELLSGGLLRVEEGPRKELPARDHKHARYVHGKEANAKRASKPVPISASLPEELKRPLPATGLKALASLNELAITSCSPSIFVQAGVNTGTVTPPLTVTFTDETPATGQTTPVGVLSTADGIKGHRIQKTIHLKIDIKDGTGSAPAYPVLVHLSVGGPRHGTLILDPDGSPIRCDQATFLWHERDAYGNIIAPNEKFEYQLGTFSSIAGFVADPANPGKAKPVWSLGEMLNVAYSVIDPSGTVTLTAFEFPVQPEPGKPDHFVGNATSHDPTGNVIELWSDYGTYVTNPPVTSASFAEFNAYYLNDQFDNPTFGYVNTSGTSGLPNVSVLLADQTSGDPTIGSDVDFFGYQSSVIWSNNPNMPQGNQAASITVNYPNDPDDDWQAGQVTKNITLQFDRGNFHFVQPWYHYEASLPDGTPGVDDGTFPLTVTPGANTDGLPTTPAGDAPRLVLLTLTGTQLPLLLPNGDREPFPDGHKYWQRSCPDGATCPPYVYATYQTRDPHDPRLEVTDSPAFALALVDARGTVITDGAFQVDFCPRYDHDSPNPPDQPGRQCTIAPMQSANGVIPSITLNPNGAGADDSRGYIGVELVKAPHNPGDYFIDVKSLGQNYRIREESNLFTNGEYQSAFRFITVVAAELLNEGFQRFDDTLNMSVDRLVYVRELNPNETTDSYAIDLVMHNEDTQADATLQNVTLRRLGRSLTFMSDAISIVSPDPPLVGLGSAATQGMTPAEASPLLTYGIRSVAGTISPTSGRYTFKDRRAGKIALTKIHRASTRLVEILNATPNFDGMTPGDPLGGANPARDRIEASVSWGVDGYVGIKLFNVDSDAIFTFDYWGQGTPLTTDLRVLGGLAFGPAEQGTKGQQRIVPSGSQFKALVAGETVWPGLYRIRAHWAPNATSALSKDADPFCVTDRPQAPVCDNEWIVSVGQRILLDIEGVAKDSLGGSNGNLSAVGDSRTPDAFLDSVATVVTQDYAAASGNVVVTRDSGMLRPYLRHLIRDTMTASDCAIVPAGRPLYGCTNTAAAFPLKDPNLDLAVDVGQGINRDHIYRGVSRAPDGTYPDHLPQQPRNTAPNSCNPTSNPCPSDVFFNRFVATVAHETAHGFGITSPFQYFVHGMPATPAATNCVAGSINDFGNWREIPCGNDRQHEPILGEWLTEPLAEGWVLQSAPYRWHWHTPTEGDAYDQISSPQHWLVFDRSMWFSRASDYQGHGEDRSLQRFFNERVPVCFQGNRACR